MERLKLMKQSAENNTVSWCWRMMYVSFSQNNEKLNSVFLLLSYRTFFSIAFFLALALFIKGQTLRETAESICELIVALITTSFNIQC